MSKGDTDLRETHGLQSWKGALGGVALAGLSIYFMVGGLELGLGSPFRPGTGAFPFFTGLILIVLSVAIILQDFGSGLAERPDWVSFLAIASALMVFALTAERFGLLPAVFLATIIASASDRSLSWGGKAILGALLAVSSWILFIEALGLPFKAFRGF